MIQLHDFELSGNCYKVRLLLSMLQIEYELIPVSLMSGEHKSPAFLELNALGQVPVLRDGDVIIRDSQAILVYLARLYGGETWLPLEAVAIAQIIQWLSTAAKEIDQSFAAARRYHLFHAHEDIDLANHKAHALLQVLEQHLQTRQWLELGHPTIADIACFPYIALAADGKIELDTYPHVIAWLNRFKLLSGYIKMPGIETQ